MLFDFGITHDKAYHRHSPSATLSEMSGALFHPQVPLAGALYAVGAHDPAEIEPQELYRQLRRLNARWHCRFYEGLVAKRSTDVYPIQLRSPNAEFVGWIKHRWAGLR